MLFAFGGEPVRCAFDRPVVALRAAAGKINLAGLRAERLSGLLARIDIVLLIFCPFFRKLTPPDGRCEKKGLHFPAGCV